jgi:hypothetical protein
MNSFYMKFFNTVFFVLVAGTAWSGTLRGTVKADDGSLLGFATLYVKQLGTGTTTNESGIFELTLPPGKYEIVFQFLGYETLTKVVSIDEDVLELNVVLKTQILVLQNVIVRAGKEDPAYTIMRKAIAKASYHTQQVDFYSARVYIKGTGQFKDIPWMFKKEMEKDGIEKDRVFITESVNEIEYRRPNTFKERVISVHSDGKDNNTSPNGYIIGSFYSPEIAETVSPLSPKAFSYYRFEYLGTFKDRTYEVSRIKVIPRSKGDNVVEGMLYIVEDAWSIHSLDFITSKLGIRFGIKQVYAPIEERVWLPVSHRYKVDARVFGFEFEASYLATVSNYKIELNKELYVEDMEVIDEKIERVKAKEVETKFAKESQDLQKRLESGKEITRKELKSLVKEYEKQEMKSQEEPAVVSNYSFEKDSITFQKDTTYWNLVRPVPLTKSEVKGYQKIDSLALEERKKEEGDTVKRKKNNKEGFQVWDIITGDSYKVSKHSTFSILAPGGGFNTVEGFNLIYRLKYGSILQDTNRTKILLSPTFRYAFSRERATGKMNVEVYNNKYRLEIEGGRYIRQFNADEPILPFVNTFTTLLFENNFMKIYEREFIEATFKRNFTPTLSMQVSTEWADRRSLSNSSTYKLIDRKSIEGYTSNNPYAQEFGAEAETPRHQALLSTFSVSARPWLRYRIRNGKKEEIENSSPSLRLKYVKGMPELGSEVDFDMLETGFKHSVRVGVRGTLDVDAQAGLFLNQAQVYFMDYKHFLGNQTYFATTDPVKSFRLLDYYRYSTSDRYFSANVHYQFRKLLATRFTAVRMLGIREDVFVNYLATPTSKNYTEVGYTLDGILRVFRLEAIASFQDGNFVDYGFRLGIATNISVRFSEN